MLVWVTLIAGVGICLLGALAVVRVDRRWSRRHQRCCRCWGTWYGEGKLCDGCGARGHDYDHLVERYRSVPSHDGQGYLDTGPIPVVPAAEVAIPEQRRPVDYTDPVWSAPAAR